MGWLIAFLMLLLALMLAAVLGSGRKGDGPAAVIGVVTLILLVVLFYTYA